MSHRLGGWSCEALLTSAVTPLPSDTTVADSVAEASCPSDTILAEAIASRAYLPGVTSLISISSPSAMDDCAPEFVEHVSVPAWLDPPKREVNEASPEDVIILYTLRKITC